MDSGTFAKLKYGNIVSEAGRQLLVTHTNKDAQGNTIAIGVSEGFQAADAAALALVSRDYSRTSIQGATDGKLVLMGETVQVEGK